MQIDKKILQTTLAITDISNNAHLDFQSKLQGILQEIASGMKAKQASLMLLKGRKNLEVAASIKPNLIGIKQPLGDNTPSSWVFKNKRPLYVNNGYTDASFKKRFDYYKKDAFFLAPIMSNSKVIGVLSVTEKIDSDSFTPQEQNLLVNIAGIVISALENNRLAESLRQKRRILHKKNLHLKKLEKLRTEMFNMLIHDLKGPISEVVANLDILSYTASRENLEYVEQAQSSCNTLYRMILDLLDIARMEEGSLDLIYERIKPKELLNESVTLLVGLAKKKDITIEKDCPEDEDIFFRGDKGILTRVLQNLLINAINYSPASETIKVGYILINNDTISFFVKDNGPGIPRQYHEAIFEKFVQLQKKKDGRRYTTGLGLTFCKMAVELHKGSILVESNGEKGSCFTISIPIR